jgi:hypothetical protein
MGGQKLFEGKNHQLRMWTTDVVVMYTYEIVGLVQSISVDNFWLKSYGCYAERFVSLGVYATLEKLGKSWIHQEMVATSILKFVCGKIYYNYNKFIIIIKKYYNCWFSLQKVLYQLISLFSHGNFPDIGNSICEHASYCGLFEVREP